MSTVAKGSLLAQLARLGACSAATKWVREHESSDAAVLWSACTQADWLLWLWGHDRSTCLNVLRVAATAVRTYAHPALPTSAGWTELILGAAGGAVGGSQVSAVGLPDACRSAWSAFYKMQKEQYPLTTPKICALHAFAYLGDATIGGLKLARGETGPVTPHFPESVGEAVRFAALAGRVPSHALLVQVVRQTFPNPPKLQLLERGR